MNPIINFFNLEEQHNFFSEAIERVEEDYIRGNYCTFVGRALLTELSVVVGLVVMPIIEAFYLIYSLAGGNNINLNDVWSFVKFLGCGVTTLVAFPILAVARPFLNRDLVNLEVQCTSLR